MTRAARNAMPGLLGALAASLLLLWGCDLFLANIEPIARIAATPLEGESPLVVQFDASDSIDPDGEIQSYAWAFGDGATGSGVTTQHTYVAAVATTHFTATLTVRDDERATARAQQSIEVRPGEVSGGGGTGDPIARIVVDRIAGIVPLTIAFDGSTSEPGADAIAAYNWEFGDGGTASGAEVSHTYRPDATQEYTATLFVWNGEGDVDTAQVRIVAIVPAELAGDETPHAAIDISDPLVLYDSPTPTTVPTLYEVTFDPRGSYADAGHAIDYYMWDFGDGSDWEIETSDLQVTHVYRLSAPSRTFIVRLFVYDDQGLEDIGLLNLTLAQPEDEE